MKGIMRYGAIGLVYVALAACDAPSATPVEPAAYPSGMHGRPITVRTSAGGEERRAMLVEPLRNISPSELAAVVRKAGYGCETIRIFDQLELEGKRLDIHKVDCLEYSYQLTFEGDDIRVKRWTGMIGA